MLHRSHPRRFATATAECANAHSETRSRFSARSRRRSFVSRAGDRRCIGHLQLRGAASVPDAVRRSSWSTCRKMVTSASRLRASNTGSACGRLCTGVRNLKCHGSESPTDCRTNRVNGSLMNAVDKDTQSSIELQFPHLSPLLSPWRDAHEARGIRPHVSLLYPWRTAPVSDRDINAVRAAIAHCTAFPITFSAIGRFPRERVLYLRIQDNVALRALMHAIHDAFPETPPYRGEHREVVPHLTIVTAGADFQLDQLEREIRLKLDAHLPLSVHAQSVIVAQENLNGIWSNVAELPLLRPRSSTLS